MWSAVRPPRSSVDEVIGLLSAPTADGGFEDEGARPQQCDPAQFDSWRNSLTKVKAVIEMCLLCATRHVLVCATASLSYNVLLYRFMHALLFLYCIFNWFPCHLPSFYRY